MPTISAALSIPASHVVNLHIPIRFTSTLEAAGALLLTTLALAIPFYLAGVLIAVALTRIPGPAGATYAVDLAGAALGSLLVLPLLYTFDISSAAILCGAIAALSAACFLRLTGGRAWLGGTALAARSRRRPPR